ncbi:MAG: TniQ family protein [Micrococcales bacterium]|nr:TniQ family protein [Micrococcales bacterium]
MHPTPGLERGLPTLVPLHPGQALDCYLEHVADANYLSTARLVHRLRAATDTTRHLMLAPTDPTLRTLFAFTGQPEASVRAATLARYDGTALDLTGLDPHTPATYRAVTARGWLPGHGTQVCPQCLAATGRWTLAWRLPTTTCCTRHGCYLLTSCPGCGRAFRDQRHSPLRIVGATTQCGNPLGRGPREQCAVDLAHLAAAPADPACLTRQRRHDLATSGGDVAVLGAPTTAREYLSTVRALAILLLHIATAAMDHHDLPSWVPNVATPRHERAPRWALKAHPDIVVRSHALTVADVVVNSPDLDTAATLIQPWLQAVPDTVGGTLGWLGDHTRMTPTLTTVIMAAHTPRRRLSHHLDTQRPLTRSPRQIPQVIPTDLYERHLTGLFTSRPQTVRLFVSLCIARTHPGVDTWAQAARILGLSADLGERAARACSAAQLATPQVVAAAVAATAADLDGHDVRDVEKAVVRFAATSRMFTRWARTERPGTRASSQRYATHWLWTHVAGAHPTTLASAGRVDAAMARAFAASLTQRQQHTLTRLVPQPQPTLPGPEAR